MVTKAEIEREFKHVRWQDLREQGWELLAENSQHSVCVTMSKGDDLFVQVCVPRAGDLNEIGAKLVSCCEYNAAILEGV